MAEEVKVPTLGESITEATVGRWFKKVGEAVEKDEPIVELETDKVAVEVNAPLAGVLSEALVNEGDTVEVGALIAKIDPEGKAAEPDASDKSEKKRKSGVKEPPREEEPDEKAKSGEEEEADQAPQSEKSKETAASPAARKLIEEHDLDPETITGSGKGGRITKEDVRTAIESAADEEEAKEGTSPEAEPEDKASPKEAREERVRMSRMRMRIAERLKEAQNTAAMLTTFNEVDLSSVIETRSKYRELFEKKHGVRLGFMSFFVKASVHALREIPSVNAEIDGEDIVYKNYYNIGVAVSTPNGLVVPVVRDANRLSFAETEKTINELGQKARDGKIALEDLQGGTFTISNGGIFGSLMSTPILNPPQSGILGMHKIEERPVVIDGEVAIRPMMYLALSYDHRMIDGREAVTFLVRIKEFIEDPNRMLIDL